MYLFVDLFESENLVIHKDGKNGNFSFQEVLIERGTC